MLSTVNLNTDLSIMSIREMKTIFITIFHGHIARNLLRTKVVEFLLARPDTNLVLIVPDYKRDYYQKEFGSERVIVEGIPILKPNLDERLIRSFYYYFIDTETVRIIQGEQFWYTGQRFKYLFMRFFTKLFGNSRFLRNLIRYIDGKILPTNLGTLFDQYKPSVIFAGSLTSNEDVLFLKEAKRRDIKTVGMIRSWDTITVNKGIPRVYPDKILVHSEILKRDVIDYGDANPETVEVVGLSHFDHYVGPPKMTREEFFRAVGGNPNKRTVFYPLNGVASYDFDAYIVGILEEMVRSNKALQDVQLFVRRHPNEVKNINFCDPKISITNIPETVDFPHNKLAEREFTPRDIDILAHALRYSDLIINTQSTTTIDAAAFDKPVINIDFDESPDKNFYKSVRRFYHYNHYQPILKSGGVRVVGSKEELENTILDYLANPAKDREGRARLLSEQNGGPLDGNASECTAAAVLALL